MPRSIEGPFLGYDKYGNQDHEYYKCTRCGAESVNRHDLRWCCE